MTTKCIARLPRPDQNYGRCGWLYEEIKYQKGKALPKDIAYRLVQECTKHRDIELGRQMQLLMIEQGLDSVAALADHLIRLFTSCASLDEAKGIFGKVLNPSEYTWHSIIEAHAKFGKGDIAIKCYDEMQDDGIRPDKFTFSSILKACSSICSIEQGRRIHEQVLNNRVQFEIFVGNTLVNMYAKCGSLEEACVVFEELLIRDVVTWGAMIAAYAQHGEGHLALDCFCNMHSEGLGPDEIIFSSILKACGSISSIAHGRHIHEQLFETRQLPDIITGGSLVDMYAKCGSLEEAFMVFNRLIKRDVTTWGAMIAGYSQHDEGCLALSCYETMKQEGIVPDVVTFLSILKACASIGSIGLGRCIHEQIVESELHFDTVVGSTLVDMYAKCGEMQDAGRVFWKLPYQDVVTWGAIIVGYTQNDEGCHALKCFEIMQHEGIKPNIVIFTSMLNACATVGSIDQGMHIHKQLIHSGIQPDIFLGNTLVDMYAKCGNMESACNVFAALKTQDIVSWGTIIAGYAQLGEAVSAVKCFEVMQFSGIKAHDIAFSGILTAFNRVGLVDEGLWYFTMMQEDHNIQPNILLMTCMVDLLGHAGCFKAAEDLLKVTTEPDIPFWLALLNCCAIHGNVELGKRCFDEIACLHSCCAPAHVLLSNIYAKAYMESNVYEVKIMRKYAETLKGLNNGIRAVRVKLLLDLGLLV